MRKVRSKATQWISVITLGAFTSGTVGCDPAQDVGAVDYGHREFKAELLVHGEDENGKTGLQSLAEETFTLGEHRWLDREIVVDGRPTLNINDMFTASETVVPLNDGGTLTLRRSGHMFHATSLSRPISSDALELRGFALKEDAFELFRSDNAADAQPNAVMRIKGLDDIGGVRRTLVATLALSALLATIEEGENIAPAVALALIIARVAAMWWIRACTRAVLVCATRCQNAFGFEVKCGALKIILRGRDVSVRPTFGLGCDCL